MRKKYLGSNSCNGYHQNQTSSWKTLFSHFLFWFWLCIFHHICNWFIVLLKYQKATVWFLKLQLDGILPVWYQHIMPWIYGSVIVTEEEVNPILALFHHIANEIATHINLRAGSSLQANVWAIFVTCGEITYTRQCLWKSCCKELASAL